MRASAHETVAASASLRALLAGLSPEARRPLRVAADIPVARQRFDVMVAAALNTPERTAALEHVACHEYRDDGVPRLQLTPPSPVRGAIMHIHGGGWCLGSARTLAPALARLALDTNTCVVSIDYRLAPEHPHPAALEDCHRASRAILTRLAAEHALKPDQVLLAGESAGAHLALLTLPGLRDEGIALAGVMLTYGLFDLSNTRPSRTRADGLPLLDGDTCGFFTRTFLGDHDTMDSSVSPWLLSSSELAGLPPALFAVGTLDPLFDDSVGMHQHWLVAGNTSHLIEYETAPHAFDLWPIPEAEHLAQAQCQFIAAHMA